MLLATSGLLCLVNRGEPFHSQAGSLYRSASLRITHNYVLAEFVALANARRFPRTACRALCQTLNRHSARLIQARERLFPATELPEPDIAELLSSDADDISALLLERIDQTVEPLPGELRGFLIYRDLIGDAVLYFFRETLRRDPRVETTLNALQQAGLRQDTRQLGQRLAELQHQQQTTRDQLLAAVQAADTARMNALMPTLNQLTDTVTAVQQHTQRLHTFQQQFADWSVYLDIRLDELQQAVIGEIRQVGAQVQQGVRMKIPSAVARRVRGSQDAPWRVGWRAFCPCRGVRC